MHDDGVKTINSIMMHTTRGQVHLNNLKKKEKNICLDLNNTSNGSHRLLSSESLKAGPNRTH